MASLFVPGVVLWALITTTPAAQAPEKKEIAVERPAGKLDYEQDTPPSTKYDKLQESPVPEEPRRDLMSQVARTIFALAVVLGLIFLFSKYGLSRLTGLRTGASGQHIEVIERVQLDPKHTLYLVNVNGTGPLLLGGGDGNLRLIGAVNSKDAPSPNAPFSATLAQTNSSDTQSSSEKGYES